MKFNKVFADILRATWAISENEIVAWLPQVDLWLKGTVEIDSSQPLTPIMASVLDAAGASLSKSYFSDVPENSIAVIPLEGPMTLGGGMCSYGTKEIASLMMEAVNSKNISGIIFSIDSGGGTTDSVYPLLAAIGKAQAAGKPIFALCFQANSAAYRVASACDKVIAENNMSMFGSIGVFVKIPDNSAYMEKQGIKTITVYAPESTDKNKPLEDALKGNVELLQSELLSPIAKDFQNAVREARAGKLVEATQGILSGRVFFAKAEGFDCVANGLIDAIGSLDFAVSEMRKLIDSKNNISTINKQQVSNTRFNMNKNQIPVLLAVLGFDAIELTDGKASLSKHDVEKLQSNFMQRFGKPLTMVGASIEEDGSATISQNGLFAINADFVNETVSLNTVLAANSTNNEKRIREEYEAKIALLGGKPEGVIMPAGGSGVRTIFVGAKEGFNVVDDNHPWNKAALEIANGNDDYAKFFLANGLNHQALDVLRDELISGAKVQGASNITLTKMNAVLGAKHMEQNTDVTDMLVALQEIDSLFPLRSTGIKDELPQIELWVDEFLQPRNADWAEKGGFELTASAIKVKNWQVSHRFTSAQMWSFIESWLALKTTGTDPFQESLVQWLTSKMMTKIASVERPYNAIRGVYVTPDSGVAGKSVNSMDGILITLARLVRDNVILPYRVGTGDYAFTDASGNINKNHVYFKRQELINRIPQALRDAFSFNVLMSKRDMREIVRFEKEMIAVNANYAAVEAAESYSNFTDKAVPNWVDGLFIVTPPGNILQGYRERGDDNRIYFQKEKRDTICHMDGGYVIDAIMKGYPYATYAELLASGGLNQRIFTNAEFGMFTPIDVAAGDTTPSVAVHTVLRTVANAGATAITTFDDAKVGDVIYLIGGSNTNSSTIAANAAAFVGIPANLTFSQGFVAKFQCTAAGKFTLLATYQENSIGAVEFDVDDTSPSVADGQLFITNLGNTGATAITNFDNATVGVQFKVLGGGGTNASTIAKSGKFAYISGAWTATLGNSIVLMKRPDGNFVEVIE